MATTSTRPTSERDSTLSMLNAAIHELYLKKEATNVTLVKSAHGSACTLLTTVRVSFLPVHSGRFLANYSQDSTMRTDYVELGLVCADVCRALDRGMAGRQGEQLSRPVFEAVEQLMTWVKPVMRARAIHLPSTHMQSRGRDTAGRSQAWQTECGLAPFPSQERRTHDRRLEVRPHQDSSHL